MVRRHPTDDWTIGGQAWDFLYADETERGVVIVPQEKAEQVIRMLPGFKDKDDLRVADVEAGMDIIETVKRHP